MAQQSSKPKIIFTTLQNLVRSSSFSKVKTQESEVQPTKTNTLNLRNILVQKSQNKSVSRHGLKSKDKITGNMFARSKSKEITEGNQSTSVSKVKVIPQKRYFDEIQKIYLDLEVALHQSKKQFFKNVMNNYQNQPKIEQDLKILVQKSAIVKQILQETKQENRSPGIRISQGPLKVLNPNEVENIDYLSRANRKNQNQIRLKKGEGAKKLTVYQQILKRRSEPVMK